MRIKHFKKIYFLILLILTFSNLSLATDYYISPSGSGSTCSLSTPCSLPTANSKVYPGDTIYIRGGTYQETINPSRSGTAENYITYANYGDETVMLTGSNAISLTKDYIAISGMTARNIDNFITMKNSNHCIIENCDMESAGTSWTMISVELNSDYNKFINNRFVRTDVNSQKELMELTNGASHNLVEGNYLEGGTHNVIVIFSMEGSEQYPAEFNIVRNNEINGIAGRAFGVRGQNGNRNAFDMNTIYNAYPNQFNADDGSSKIQSDFNIVRRNTIYNIDTTNVLSMAAREKVNTDNNDNKVYANTFHNIRGVIYMGCCAGDGWIRDNKFYNNLVYGKDNDLFQVGNAVGDGNDFFNGILFHQIANKPDKINYRGNVFLDPLFVSINNHDYHLSDGSPAIDAGAFLTTTTSAGSGTTMIVEDSDYFMDGWGITEGDLIQLEGQTKRVRITNINYGTNTLTLDSSLSWSSGQGVSLAYTGSAPDIGAYEYGLDESDGWGELVFSNTMLPQNNPTPYHKADINKDRCIDVSEVISFISRWRYNSADVELKELFEAVKLWGEGC
jgi:hypothetical protein